MSDKNEFHGEIVVASRIVDFLSSGLYESPAACLKELINNSYDADATRVDLFVKPDADRIIIQDDGNGMDKADFEKHFTRISESYKRDDTDETSSGRPIIGKIGIGFIAANEICNIMEIESTKKGSTELLEVAIDFSLMRQDPNERRRNETEIAKGDYRGTVRTTDKNSHFTRVFLKEVRGEARNILAGVKSTHYTSGKLSLYGLNPSSICNEFREKQPKAWSQFDAYSKNMLEIALNVPVSYHDHWLPSYLRKKVSDIEEIASSLNFKLFIDGSEIKKPIVFNPQKKAIISRFNFNGKDVSAKGYFYAQHGTIKPEELQGILIRIRNAAVGEHDPTYLGFPSTIGPLFQSWISGEILADDRLEDAMNIDRRTLRIAHPAYVELQKAIHEHIYELIKRIRSDIYGEGSKKRNIEKADKVIKKIKDVTERQIVDIAPKAANSIERAWSNEAAIKTGQKALLKKYSVDQLYQIVVEVSQEILKPDQLEKFLLKLTERLKK